MRGILGTTWGASILSAIFGAMLIGFGGIIVGAPPAVTLFAGVIFGALLILIVQLGVVVTVLWQSRGTSSDIGATMMREVETPEGQQELMNMDFTSLLTVAVVQELYTSLFQKDSPLWIWEFFGIGSEHAISRDYGRWNRYLEWAVVIGLFGLTIVSTILIAAFVNSVASPRGLAISSATLLCVFPAFVLGGIFSFFVWLFFASVIRRLFILYSMRTDEDKIA